MYQAIEASTRHRLDHNLRYVNIPTGDMVRYYSFLKYKKRITDQEQFIPLFSCIPSSLNVPLTAPPNDWFERPMVKSIFPNLSRVASKYKPWLMQFALSTLDQGFSATRGSGITNVLSHFASTNPSGDVGRITRAAFGNGKERVALSLKQAHQHLITNKEWLKDHIRYIFRTASPDLYALPGFTYTSAQRGGFTASRLIEGTELNAQQHVDGFVTKYGFLGQTGVLSGQQTRCIPIALERNYLNVRSSSDVYPTSSSLFCGLDVLFCVVVKAKRRQEIFRAAILGKLEELEFEQGDIELWEHPELKQRLPRGNNKRYNELYHSAIRNHLKAPVRQVKDLTHKLFDLKDYMIDESKEDPYEDLKKQYLARAIENLSHPANGVTIEYHTLL